MRDARKMNYQRYAINAYAREYAKVQLPFPGMTTVLDCYFDKIHDIATKYKHAQASPSYLVQCIRRQARRDAQEALRLRSYYEKAISEMNQRESQSFESEVDARIMIERVIDEIARLPAKQRDALGALMNDERAEGKALQRGREAIRRKLA